MSNINSLITVPEFILQEGLVALLNAVRKDYRDAADKTFTWLYKLTNGAGFQRYNLYTQGIEILMRDETHQRYVDVDLMYNMKRDGMPHITITLPAEQQQAGGNGIGMDEGYSGYIYEDHEEEEEATDVTAVLTRRYQAIYNIIITSDNSNEVIFLYHFLKSLVVASSDHWNLAGIQNFTLGGTDINVRDLTPPNVFSRSFSINLQYESRTPRFWSQKVANELEFTGTPAPDITTETTINP